MQSSSKWIRGTSPDQPVSEVARCAAEVRLGFVRALLPLAARKAEDDVEYVHQLRVGTRRAMAMLKVFKPLFPRRRRKHLAAQLKEIRQAAGDARDYDVMILHFTSNGSAAELHRELADFLFHLRQDAQRPLEEVERAMAAAKFEQKLEQLISRVRWRKRRREPTFGQFARRGTRKGIAEFVAASRAEFTDLDQVHQFRIACKRLRYTMELFAGAMPSGFRKELYPRLLGLQDRLGALNDHAMAAHHLGFLARQAPTSLLAKRLESLAANEEESSQSSYHEFVDSWSPKNALRLRQAFDDLLASASTAH